MKRPFTKVAESLWGGLFNSSTDTYKCIILSSTPSESNFDTWKYYSDVTNESTGTGYTAGGATAAFTFTSDAATNSEQWTIGNINFGANVTITGAGIAFYKSTGTGSTSPLIDYYDLPISVTNTSLVVAPTGFSSIVATVS